MVEQAFFYIFAVVAVITGLVVITHRNAIYSAIALVITFFSLAAIYILLNAQFIAAVQVIVYAGAIMVLFLFVIMLLSAGDSTPKEPFSVQRVLGVIFAALLLAQVVVLFKAAKLTGVKDQITPELVQHAGSTELIGNALFTRYLFPFEVVSILLLLAIIGAVVLGRKKS